MVSKDARSVYVLHITEPDGTVWHYVGSAKRSRLEQRMKEHRNSRGSIIVRAASQRGATIELANIVESIGYTFEGALAKSTIVPTLCALCNLHGVNGLTAAANWRARRRASGEDRAND